MFKDDKVNPNSTYIGDGVYVSFDGWQLLLETERYGNIDRIYIDSQMFVEVLRFARKHWDFDMKKLDRASAPPPPEPTPEEPDTADEVNDEA